MLSEIEDAELHRRQLEEALRTLIRDIGEVPIGVPGQFPYGWRKAGKGRTVWRILEELISQNLEKHAKRLHLHDFKPADSEVGVYDFSFRFDDSKPIFVNIKSAVRGRTPSKDDISKADKLITFFENTPELTLFIATIEIDFHVNPLRIELVNCYVVPTAWLPDLYVNPSNNAIFNLLNTKILARQYGGPEKNFSSC
ncbi:hypothetical protein ACFQY5_35850 [Paeniroseomonas aquatica]|uniref:hypothetical protein n=1 Tax=Paeniroseomonas aquatica TaxID=373043 RepID=UPI0036219476